jgi:hypothetical protein
VLSVLFSDEEVLDGSIIDRRCLMMVLYIIDSSNGCLGTVMDRR